MGEGNLTTGLIWPDKGNAGGRRGGCEGCTNWSDLASDEGGGVGGVGQGGGQGGGDGGAPESSVGATRRALVPPFGLLKNLTIGLIWLGLP